jgi:small-conductance mechanosensitive channel
MPPLSFLNHAPAWIITLLSWFLWMTLLFLLKRILFAAIRKFAQQTVNHWDDVFLKAADFPVTLLIFASGGLIIQNMLPLMQDPQLAKAFLTGFKVVTIVAIVLFVDRFASGMIEANEDKVEVFKVSSDVVQVITRFVIFTLGVLVLLDSFGISITPILASLGIGSLAVALALQPTLENLFSGAQLTFDKTIQVGHFIKLESGEEGYVHKIGWRSSWIRMTPNNMIVIPNKNIVNSKVINYYYPTKDLAVPVEVGVHYSSDLEHVEKVTIEVAQEVMKTVAGGVADFEPAVRFHTFDDFSINFAVILRAKEFSDGAVIKHEFIKRLQKRYMKEGIVIPYPVEAVNYSQENSSLLLEELMDKQMLKESMLKKKS